MKLIQRKGTKIIKRWTEKVDDEEVIRNGSQDFKSINTAKRESRLLQAAGWTWELFA